MNEEQAAQVIEHLPSKDKAQEFKIQLPAINQSINKERTMPMSMSIFLKIA
jgi:hypothetical protein